ncbi:MAG: carbohydrate kinase family protein [Lachnospiraceae bacterium]|nr:carbohydrate kinase family protein [Lachnospiraceae bacterium]
MGIVVIGAVFVDIKGFPEDTYIPNGRNAGVIEYIHGGVRRNVAENIANLELRPTFVSLVDESAMGAEVVHKLRNHKVNLDYIQTVPDGMGTWLAVFDSTGDVAGSISRRPDLMPILDILNDHGDEIFRDADSIVVEIDMDKEIIKRVFELAETYGKRVYAVVSNMSIALKRRDFIKRLDCFVCNQQEAGLLFATDYADAEPEEMVELLAEQLVNAQFQAMVVTMGSKGSVYADQQGRKGFCPAMSVQVKDTTGAGDAFCSGLVVGLTYGKTLQEACEIGTRLSAAVIVSNENVCPRFLPRELGIEVDVEDEAGDDIHSEE